jgi:hypothetical protein
MLPQSLLCPPLCLCLVDPTAASLMLLVSSCLTDAFGLVMLCVYRQSPLPCHSSNFLRVFRHVPEVIALALLDSDKEPVHLQVRPLDPFSSRTRIES